MEVGKIILVVFYGIFWASAIHTVARYRAFDTHAFFSPEKGRYALKRFLWAVLIMDILPVFWLLYLYFFIIPQDSIVCQILCAGFASLTALAFPRFLHAKIATEETWPKYYAPDEWQYAVSKTFYQPNTQKRHFLGGLLYLLGFTALALLVKDACDIVVDFVLNIILFV